MAAKRTFTLAQLETRLREMTDTESDDHLSQAEMFRIISSAAAETWDVIISAGLQSHFVKTVDFSTVANQLNYDLTSAGVIPDQDFYKIYQIYVDESNGQYRPIDRINPSEVRSFRPPQAVATIRLKYYPFSPDLTTGAQTFPGINGFEEHLLATAAATVKAKKEDDYGFYLRKKSEQEKRILAMNHVSAGTPPRVSRRRRTQFDTYVVYTNSVNAFNVVGDNLELFYHYGYVP